MSIRGKVGLWAVNLVGGAAVLGSYAHGILTHAEPGETLWSGIPTSLRPFYNVSMLAATAGYFMFVPVVFGKRPADAKIFGRDPTAVFTTLFALILAPSAIWMPLTFSYAADPTPAKWAAIRATLGVVGVASLVLVAALIKMEPKPPTFARRAAILGAVLFAFQTGVLDALVWTAFYRAPSAM